MTGILDMVPALRRVGANSGGEYAGPCPWCGGTDRFRVWPEHPSGHARWWCRQCSRHGDTIDLLRQRDGLGFREAAAAVGRPVDDRRPALTPRASQTPLLTPPPSAWQSQAEAAAVEAEGALWEPQGARALAYLRGRGFADETIRGARLGYVPRDRRENPEAWGLAAMLEAGANVRVWVEGGLA